MTKAIEQRGARHCQACAGNNRTSLPLRHCDVLKSTRKMSYARVDARELPEVLRAIEVYQGTRITRLALKLMTLTFVRTSELIGARWAEFDLRPGAGIFLPNA